MPRPNLFTKEQVVDAALALVRQSGPQALTARALGQRLGASARPIFGHFAGMAAVQQAVLTAAKQAFIDRIQQEMAAGRYPVYKASGMAYIHFAQEERQLFQLLFMRDRTSEDTVAPDETFEASVQLLQQKLGLSAQDARAMHLSMWVCVHGIAAMVATGYLAWDETAISRLLTDNYEGLLARFGKNKKE